MYIFNLPGSLIRSFRAHHRAVNDISTDTNCLNIAACSDNGAVMVYSPNSDENKEHIVQFNEPLKAVCVEEEAGAKKEKSFIVGSLTDSLTH